MQHFLWLPNDLHLLNKKLCAGAKVIKNIFFKNKAEKAHFWKVFLMIL